ncbi:outer membrane protein [Aureimonas sp. SA4125]|uniref:outer membrane protein n=1 Tax=Aureimonas sp. SA4125 TaxID=2826993 RepID=UPI001CC3E3D5|nr:outer membrane protein [Aureimonas sp. SA4125]BDA83789.1 outer membrane protein [Aureimonas sp. SA4125]
MRSFRHTLAASALFAASTLGMAGASIAADIVAPEVSAAAPIHIWSGPYAGGFVGYSSSDFDQANGADYDGEGVVGGIYGGFNLQSGQIVYGVEADLGYSGLDAGGVNAATGAGISADSNAFGSLRGRVGVAYDPFLFFATGGVALANKELTSGGVEDDNTHVGYTLGAGVEAQVLPNVTSRLEYRYSDFDAETYDFGATSTSTGFDEHSVRAGLALKF